MTMTQLLPITIIPVENFRDQEPTTFGEVVAYLRGVADAMSRVANDVPPSIMPFAGPASGPAIALATERPSSGTRVTLRFGELPYERASVWPHVVVGSDWEITRGGSRTLDLGTAASRSSWSALRRGTLPYDAPSISLAPRASMLPIWVDERSSEVRLRSARLPVEWYELTGTDAATLRATGGV